LRVQIKYIWQDALRDNLHRALEHYVPILRREYGLHRLAERPRGIIDYENVPYSLAEEGMVFFGETDDVNRAVDVVELIFGLIYERLPDHGNKFIEELNKRFLEHKIGYQFEAGKIVRLDSTYMHNEAVKPALMILSDPIFKGAQSEFLKAHEHLRNGRAEEALVDALKALESTMKVICSKHEWEYAEGDTAKKLIAVCLEHELVPAAVQSEFAALRAILESGVPTLRNKMAGHGAGSQPRNVPTHIAAYALHLTAATIVFLAQAERDVR